MPMPDGRPDPFELWTEAGGGTASYSRERYQDLLREHGHLIPLQPDETAEPLPCGWPRTQPAIPPGTPHLTGMREEQEDWDGDNAGS